MHNPFTKTSQLHITAAYKDGRTILEDCSFSAPFKIMVPFYEREDVMTAMILLASAGILSGDCQELHLRVKPGSKMKLISQSYEKIHKMENGYAARNTAIEIEHAGYLDYAPLPTIPFAGSDFRSSLSVNLMDESSRFIYREILTCGRIAHGEKFLYRNFQNRVSIFQNGHIVYFDNAKYQPSKMDMAGFGMYEGFTHLANLLLCNIPKPKSWITQVWERIGADERLEGGVTKTAAGHILIRVLGTNGDALTKLLDQFVNMECFG